MTATIHRPDFKANRMLQAALRKAERVRELTEDFAAIRGVNGATDEEARAVIATYYVDRGMASEGEVREALRSLEEANGE